MIDELVFRLGAMDIETAMYLVNQKVDGYIYLLYGYNQIPCFYP